MAAVNPTILETLKEAVPFFSKPSVATWLQSVSAVKQAMAASLTEPAALPEVAAPLEAEEAVPFFSKPSVATWLQSVSAVKQVAAPLEAEVETEPVAHPKKSQVQATKLQDPSWNRKTRQSNQEWPVGKDEQFWTALKSFDIRRCPTYSRHDLTGQQLKPGARVEVIARIFGRNEKSDFLKLVGGEGFIFLESRSGQKLFSANSAAGSKHDRATWTSWHQHQEDSGTGNRSWSTNNGNNWQQGDRATWTSWRHRQEDSGAGNRSWSTNGGNKWQEGDRATWTSWRHRQEDSGAGNRSWSANNGNKWQQGDHATWTSWHQRQEDSGTGNHSWSTNNDNNWQQGDRATWTSWHQRQEDSGTGNRSWSTNNGNNWQQGEPMKVSTWTGAKEQGWNHRPWSTNNANSWQQDERTPWNSRAEGSGDSSSSSSGNHWTQPPQEEEPKVYIPPEEWAECFAAWKVKQQQEQKEQLAQ